MNAKDIAERLGHIEHPQFGYARDLVSFDSAVRKSLSHLKSNIHYNFADIFSWEMHKYDKYAYLIEEIQKGHVSEEYPNEHGWYITNLYVGVGIGMIMNMSRQKQLSLFDIRTLGIHSSGCFWLLDHEHLPDILKSEMGRAVYSAWKQQTD